MAFFYSDSSATFIKLLPKQGAKAVPDTAQK